MVWVNRRPDRRLHRIGYDTVWFGSALASREKAFVDRIAYDDEIEEALARWREGLAALLFSAGRHRQVTGERRRRPR